MGSLAIRVKQVGVYQVPISFALMKNAMLRSAFWAYNSVRQRSTNVSLLTLPLNIRRIGIVHCTFGSCSNGSGNITEKENDEDYVNSNVIEAVEVKSGLDGLTLKMRDGSFLNCVHNITALKVTNFQIMHRTQPLCLRWKMERVFFFQ